MSKDFLLFRFALHFYSKSLFSCFLVLRIFNKTRSKVNESIKRVIKAKHEAIKAKKEVIKEQKHLILLET